MKSESIHRVASALNVKAHYDTKIKMWTIGGRVFTSDKIGKITAVEMRKLFAEKQAPKQPDAAPSSPTETAEHKAKVAKGKAAGKPKAAPKKAKATKKAARFDEVGKITLLVKENPKRQDTAAHRNFSKYRDELLVGEFLKSGGARADLSWDIKHKFIAISS